MNVYSVNLGHARPELERSILLLSYYEGPQRSIMDKPLKDSFEERVNRIVTKEGPDYFIKSVVREPFPIRKFK